jgi:hypothetical protein
MIVIAVDARAGAGRMPHRAEVRWWPSDKTRIRTIEVEPGTILSAMTAASSRFGVFDLYMAAALGKAIPFPAKSFAWPEFGGLFGMLTGYSPVSDFELRSIKFMKSRNFT